MLRFFKGAVAAVVVVILCGATAAGAQTREASAARPRPDNSIPAGEVAVTLNEQLFNSLLEGVLSISPPPSYALGAGGSAGGSSSSPACASEVRLAPESGGVRTGVRLEQGRITAPLAFRGSYDGGSLFGCFNFEGLADTEIGLSFDAGRQALNAMVRVRGVTVRGLPEMLSTSVTGLVQRAVDARLNPLELLRAEQLSARLPLAKGGKGPALRLRAREVRPEMLPGELRLRITYAVERAE